MGTLTVRAPSFLWHQIRKMITSIRWVAKGNLSMGQLKHYLTDQEKPPSGIPPAPPEGLILAHVHYGLQWHTEPYILQRAHRYWNTLHENLGQLIGASKTIVKHISELMNSS